MDLLQFDLYDEGLSILKGCSSYAPPEKVRLNLKAILILSISSVANFPALVEISG